MSKEGLDILDPQRRALSRKDVVEEKSAAAKESIFRDDPILALDDAGAFGILGSKVDLSHMSLPSGAGTAVPPQASGIGGDWVGGIDGNGTIGAAIERAARPTKREI